jgi:hypothetical protein
MSGWMQRAAEEAELEQERIKELDSLVAELEAENAKLRTALEKLEWWSRRAGHVMQCPVCFHLERDGTHAHDCFIAKALQRQTQEGKQNG